MNTRFGIIGFGFIGHIHEAMITNSLDGGTVSAICDNVPKKMDDAVTPDVKKYTQAEDLVKDPNVDVVIIATPNHLHREMVHLAAQAHKDIICEKPAAMTTAEFDEMMAEVEACGVQFTVHQQRRYDRGFRLIKHVYDEGLVGKPYTIQSKLYGYNGNMHDWHVYKKYGGGMMFDWGVHLIDQILWMIKAPVVSVYADIRNVINEEVDDYFKVLFRFENGVQAEIELGTYFLKDDKNWYTQHWFIGGDQATAYCDGFMPDSGVLTTTTQLLTSPKDNNGMEKTGPTRSFIVPEDGILRSERISAPQTEYLDYYKNYLQARAGQCDFLVKKEEVRRVLKLMELARQSAEKGCSISVK